MKRTLLVALIFLTTVALLACTTGASSDDEKKEESKSTSGEQSGNGNAGEKILRLNNLQEPKSFDPSVGYDVASWDPLNNLMEGLTRQDEQSIAVAGVAERWEISDDGTVFTFYLRDDAKWSNGDDIVAEDFVFSWKHMLNPETASLAAFLGYYIKGGEDFNRGEGSSDDVAVKAVSDKVLEVELEEPTGFFLDLLTSPAFFPIHHKIAEENPKWHTEADSFVSNGPFKLSEWVHDSHMLFEKNEEYWDADVVKLDQVHWSMVNDVNTSYQMFESGDIDISSIPPELSDQLIDGDNVFIGDYGGLEFIRFNVTQEPFQNKKIRQGIAMAINREDIANFVVKNRVEPAYGIVSPGFIGPNGVDFREHQGDLIGYDLEQAEQLLKEGMQEEGYDTLPAITFTYNTSDTNKAVAEAVQSMLMENLGIEITLENMEWGVFVTAQENLELNMSRGTRISDYNDPINILESFISGSTMNRTGFSNEEFDELVRKGKSETDEAQRWEYIYEAEHVLMDEMVAVPIRFYNNVSLEAEGVSGILRHAVGFIDLKYADKE